jgi:succinate dehydrogenase/fumarate reductase cytochrome b subunit
MPDTEEKKLPNELPFVNDQSDDDDRELVALGYKPSFKREFTNLATVRLSSIPACLYGLINCVDIYRSVLPLVSWYSGESLGSLGCATLTAALRIGIDRVYVPVSLLLLTFHCCLGVRHLFVPSYLAHRSLRVILYPKVTWCWILGASMCFTLGSSIAEIVSAYPTCGGL